MVEAVTNNVLAVPSVQNAAPDKVARDLGSAAAVPASGPPSSRSADSPFDNKSLDKIASRLVSPDSRLAISQDNVIQRFIYKFVDKSNGNVIRQYPQPAVVESLHAIAASIERFLDKRA